MLPMLEVKKKMNAIKQFSEEDNAYQKPPITTQFFKNSSSRNVIKNVFDIDMHHGPIRV
jgi:hypothetical protein